MDGHSPDCDRLTRAERTGVIETPDQISDLSALAIVREWVEGEVSDWYDPVISPDLHDALRILVGLPPYERAD